MIQQKITLSDAFLQLCLETIQTKTPPDVQVCAWLCVCNVKCVCDVKRVRVLAVLLLYEGVGNGLHAVLRTDEHDGGSSADHQPQLPGVFCQLQLVVWICTYTHIII